MEQLSITIYGRKMPTMVKTPSLSSSEMITVYGALQKRKVARPGTNGQGWITQSKHIPQTRDVTPSLRL